MIKKQTCGIYRITNQVNQKVYIGQSIRIEKRWEEHKRKPFLEKSEDYNYPLYQAIRKYGLENFTFEIIEECSPEDLNWKEEYYISLYESYPLEKGKGYNQTPGGGNQQWYRKLSPELFESIIYDLKNSNLTQLQIAEKYHLDKMTINGINKGEERYFQEGLDYPIRKKSNFKFCYCKNCGVQIYYKSKLCAKCRAKKLKYPLPSKEELLKQIYELRVDQKVADIYNISTMLLKKWKDQLGIPRKRKDVDKLYEERYFHISSRKEKPKRHFNSNPVFQISLETNKILNEFKSCAEAARSLGAKSGSHINKCCLGKKNSAYGYKWVYKLN